MRTLLTVLTCFFIAGCAAHRPPATVPEDFVRRYGCDPQELQQRADQLRERLSGATKVYIPQTGWTACELIAHNGRPSEVDRTSGYGQQSETWWYQGNEDMGMVRLVLETTEGWVVDYVSW